MTATVGELAARCADRAGELSAAETVPADLWRDFGEAGLFRIGMPEAYGGAGGGWSDIAAAGRTLAKGSGVLGLVTSWAVQCQIARFFLLGFGSDAQKQDLLPKLATGEITASVAISEPDVGAHPKHLATSAEREGDAFVISGRKHWLTNGPMADLFLVLAITAEEAGRKRFSLLLVPRSAAGLNIVDMPSLDILRPSPHCGLQLTDCRVPTTACLGPEGHAFEAMGRPLRDVEDALMTSGLAGAMTWQLDYVAGLLPEASRTDTVLESLGALRERLEIMNAVAAKAAADLDAAPLQEPPASALAGGFRLLAAFACWRQTFRVSSPTASRQAKLVAIAGSNR